MSTVSSSPERLRKWDAGQHLEYLRGNPELYLHTRRASLIAEAGTYTADGGAIGWLAQQSVRFAREFGNGRIPTDLAKRLAHRDAAVLKVTDGLARLLEDTRRRVGSEAQWTQQRAASHDGMIGIGQFASVLVRQPYAMTREDATITCLPHENRVIVNAQTATFGLRLWKNGDGGVTFTDLPGDHLSVEIAMRRGDQDLSFDAMPPLPATATANTLAGLLDNRLTNQEISRQCYDQQRTAPPAI